MTCRALAVYRTIIIASVETVYRKRPCLFSANCNFVKSVYCLVKAIQFYIQQLNLIKLQLAENKHGLLR